MDPRKPRSCSVDSGKGGGAVRAKSLYATTGKQEVLRTEGLPFLSEIVNPPHKFVSLNYSGQQSLCHSYVPLKF